MGNTPSSIEAAPRRSHKLSKPRTGNPATAGLLSPNGFSNSTGRFSTSRMSIQAALPRSPVQASSSSPAIATSAAPLELSGESEEPVSASTDKMVTGPAVQKKESRRRSLFRSGSSQKTTTKPARRNSSVGPPSSRATVVSPADNLGRANSMTYETTTHIVYYAQPPVESWSSAASRRTSWNYDMSSYEAKRLLNLVEEPAFEQTTTMSENRMTVVSEATWKSSNPIAASQTTSTPISRANSDLSLYTPVRRRSVIQTPGVATRTRATPAPSKSYRHSHPPTPSMSRQQSFESTRSGIISMPPRIMDPDSMPRVVTPCEEEYQSIGAFKLGSLRITNGAVSPVSPEMEKKKVGEPNLSSDRDRTDYFSGVPPAALEQGETVGIPSNRAHGVAAPQPRASNLSPIAASFQEAELARISSDMVVQDSSVKVTETPQEYLAEISFTDFTLTDSRPLSPELQITSKHTAIEDSLFDDDGNLEYSSVEVLDVRLDLNAKSQPNGPLDAHLSLRSVTRTDSGFVSADSPSSEAPHKPLTKADSGYSSNVSLRSFHTSKSQAAENEFTHILERQMSLAKLNSNLPQHSEQQPHSTAGLSLETPAQPLREAPPPPVPPKDYAVPASPTSKFAPGLAAGALSPGSGLSEPRLTTPNGQRKSRHTPSPINSMRSSETGPRSPDSVPRTPLSARSDGSTSALSIGSGSNRPSKLQRLLSGARRSRNGPPMVHVTHALDKAGIPSIPQEVETKLHEHTGLFPITTKRLALKPQLSKDTLKTIFSVGSMDISLDGMNPTRSASPTWPADEMPDQEESHGRTLVHSVQNSIAHAAAHIIPRKPIARKPVPFRQVSVEDREREVTRATESDVILPSEAELTSYNAISTSLGSNPYDAALMAMGDSTSGPRSPPAMAGRTMSLTASVERNLYMNVRKANSTSSLRDPQGIALPSPLLPRETVLPKKAKTPPPVSMMTRRPMPLRVPPSLRHQSSGQSLSRKTSRESINSYPSYGPDGQPTLFRKTSRENVQSYPSYQQGPPPEPTLSPPPIPPMDPRRTMSFRSQNRPPPMHNQYRAPNWQPQPEHQLSRRSSMSSMDNGSRRNSLSSSSTHPPEGPQVQRPTSTQPYRGHPNQPPLRHRASYDSYSSNKSRGHPPSMSNGYTAPVKPQLDQRQFNHSLGLSQPQVDQYGRYPSPHVPRGHYRNRSMGNRSAHPVNPPYRVLHSYNSPAYRHVPIWG